MPDYIDEWAQELLHRCWKSNPVASPFGEILDLLLANSAVCKAFAEQNRSI